MRLILPSTFNPYNMVEYLELAMGSLDVQLLTNSEFVHIVYGLYCACSSLVGVNYGNGSLACVHWKGIPL